VTTTGPLRVELPDYWVELWAIDGRLYMSPVGGSLPRDGGGPGWGWIEMDLGLILRRAAFIGCTPAATGPAAD